MPRERDLPPPREESQGVPADARRRGTRQREDDSRKQQRIEEVIDPDHLGGGIRVRQRADQEGPVDHEDQEEKPPSDTG